MTSFEDQIDLDLLLQMNKAVPRYTSYPTAPEWEDLSSEDYRGKLEELADGNDPLSLYFHIPFCRTMCLFCGCSVILNRREDRQETYVDYLLKEIQLLRGIIGSGRKVTQIHFGGGTPTQLTIPQFSRLFRGICDNFSIDFQKEVAMEIDPRTVVEDKGQKLAFLRKLGFNRVSFGVQDTNAKVQEAVRRRQSYEMTRETMFRARELGFQEVNLDLIYGLPHQTVDTFRDTIEKIIDLNPDRIALFSWARVPWLKPHQNAIRDEDLPGPEEKFRIYLLARKALIAAGYQAIGMDHFAKMADPLSEAYCNGTLGRNFQGYTVAEVENLIGLGVTSIGQVEGAYFQNQKDLEGYYEALDQGNLPTIRGKILSPDDHLRKWVIWQLMCRFELDKKEFENRFGRSFDLHFQDLEAKRANLVEDGLLEEDADCLRVTEKGKLFVRNVACIFDWYLGQEKAHRAFSKAV